MLVPFSQKSLTGGPIRVAVFGSTGSVGRSTLEVARRFPEEIEVVALVAHSNYEELSKQIDEFHPLVSGLCCDTGVKKIRERHKETRVLHGDEEFCAWVREGEYDCLLAAIVGSSGLSSVVAALETGKRVALANKESLVCAGRFVQELIETNGAEIVPVDSEHSAIFSLLQGVQSRELKGVTLTASGGPFRETPLEALVSVTPEQAANHPRWSMGQKISIDSATLMNKALELIEASWLFGLPESDIRVVIHPESIIHSLIDFCDGSQNAQLSLPDMCGPIRYALLYPFGRAFQQEEPLSLTEIGALHFFEVDEVRFPSLSLAREVMRSGGDYPAIFNEANEVAVDAFVNRKLGFTDIVSFVRSSLDSYVPQSVESVSDLMQMLQEERARMQGRINSFHS